jgi:mRNA interferase RelE/StbE
MRYQLKYSESARNQIQYLHPELKLVIRKQLKKLAKNPYLGKHLEKKLSTYFSLRARRFRIIYMIKEIEKTIEIHYVGHRKDIYELFKGQFIEGSSSK